MNIDKLLSRGLNPVSYAMLLCLKEERKFPWELSDNSKNAIIKNLSDNGFINVTGDSVILRGKALEILDSDVQEDIINLKTCESWIDSWINLWPKGVKSGGRPVRASRATIIKKMNTLLLNKKYKIEDIIDCTTAYISEKEKSQWAYISCADYFIKKDGSSLLEALLEEFDRDSFEQESKGESDFYKLL